MDLFDIHRIFAQHVIFWSVSLGVSTTACTDTSDLGHFQVESSFSFRYSLSALNRAPSYS